MFSCEEENRRHRRQRHKGNALMVSECSYSLLRSELEDTTKLLAGTFQLSISAPDNGTVQIDHALFLTVAENLIGKAARYAKSEIIICLQQKENLLRLSVTDDGPGYPAELLQNGPKPFGKLNGDSAHFGMGFIAARHYA